MALTSADAFGSSECAATTGGLRAVGPHHLDADRPHEHEEDGPADPRGHS